MCFCAQASFAAASVLSVVGLLSIMRAKKTHRFLAAIPLIFAGQQAAEGVLWITSHNNDLVWIHVISTYIFLLCAFVIWPTWVPLSFMFINGKKKHHKQIFKYLLIFGACISATLLGLIIFRLSGVATEQQHVQYLFGLPEIVSIIGTFLYAIPVVIPWFVIQKRACTIFGILLVASALITWFMWYEFFISVWCFFAAILSVLVLFLVLNNNGKR